MERLQLLLEFFYTIIFIEDNNVNWLFDKEGMDTKSGIEE